MKDEVKRGWPVHSQVAQTTNFHLALIYWYGMEMSLKNETCLAESDNSEPGLSEFIEQINQHHGSLLRYARQATGNPSLADDLLQETYLKAWVAYRDIHDWRLFKAWINTILRRERARWYTKNRKDLVSYDEESLATFCCTMPIDDDNKQLLFAEVSALPKLYRDPMWLFLQGTRCEDIAIHLELNLNTVLTRLRRARGCLLARMKV